VPAGTRMAPSVHFVRASASFPRLVRRVSPRLDGVMGSPPGPDLSIAHRRSRLRSDPFRHDPDRGQRDRPGVIMRRETRDAARTMGRDPPRRCGCAHVQPRRLWAGGAVCPALRRSVSVCCRQGRGHDVLALSPIHGEGQCPQRVEHERTGRGRRVAPGAVRESRCVASGGRRAALLVHGSEWRRRLRRRGAARRPVAPRTQPDQ
jgi:hypothetical protein